MRSIASQYKDLRYTWSNWSLWWAVILNVLGFLPVGFVFYAYFTSVKRIEHPAITVALLGLFLSFSIEALQWFFPNRDSGMNDLFTNTTGTLLGVLLYRWSYARNLWAKVLSVVIPSADVHMNAAFQTAPAVNAVPPIREEISIAS